MKPQALAPLQCRDEARPVLTDQAETACTEREAPCRIKPSKTNLTGEKKKTFVVKFARKSHPTPFLFSKTFLGGLGLFSSSCRSPPCVR